MEPKKVEKTARKEPASPHEAKERARKINWMERLGWTDEQLDDLRVTGYAYIRQGKYSIAIPFFEALNVLGDNSYDAQTLGALYVQIGNPAKALRFLDRALKLQPDHGPTLLNLAKAFLMLGNRKEGLKIAAILKKSRDVRVRSMAEAIFLAFG